MAIFARSGARAAKSDADYHKLSNILAPRVDGQCRGENYDKNSEEKILNFIPPFTGQNALFRSIIVPFHGKIFLPVVATQALSMSACTHNPLVTSPGGMATHTHDNNNVTLLTKGPRFDS